MGRRLLLATVIGLIVTTPGLAQRVTASIDGTVRDETGLALPGASIAVRNVETGLRRDAVSDADGRFVIPSLPVEGSYEVRVERAGFAGIVRDPVPLLPDQTVTIDVTLRVAAATQVIVGGSAVEPSVDREHSTVRQTIDEQLVRGVPLFGRGFIQLVSLTAGFTGHPDFPNPQGQAYSANNVLVDGASHFSKWRSAPRSFYSGYGLESIKQVQVLTNVFSAEFGEALASITSVATKAGTNTWHGSALLFVRDDAFDAVPPFATHTPPGGAQQFGASLGGPLRQDRTHLFSSYEGRRARDHNIVVSPARPNAEVPDDQDEHLFFVRLDHQKSNRHLVTARYNGQIFRWDHQPGGLMLPGSGTRFRTDVHTLLATDALQLSGRTLNELRVQFARFIDLRTDLNPTVFVSRAGYSIEGGPLGPGGFGADPEDTWEAANTVSHFVQGHAVRFGGGVKTVRAHNTALPYGRGAYFFAGPPDRFPQPFQYTQGLTPSVDAPIADPRGVSTFLFIQDDWRTGAGITVNAGVRYDIETVSHLQGTSIPTDTNNVQPRLGAAWDVGGNGRTVIRAGIGVYTQQHLLFSINRAELEGPDGVALVSIPGNSPLLPTFPGTLPPSIIGLRLPPRDVYRVDQTFRNPYAVQAALGAQREWRGAVISADYVYLSGRDLTSVVDANAPASVQKPAQRTVQEADATRPLTPVPDAYRKVLTLGNEGRSWYRALQLKAERSTASFQALGSYTIARAEDMAADLLPEDSRNIAAEQARASTDIRHNVSVGFTWVLPGTGGLAGGWSVSGIGVFRSHRPYTVTWGDDRNGTTQNDARPAGRNTAKTGPYRTVDLAVSRQFPSGPATIEARFEVFNLLNAANYDQYVGQLLSPLYGKPISAFPQRRLQLAAILRF